MQLTIKECKFGFSIKEGKGLVCERYRTGRVIVFESQYNTILSKYCDTHTVINSHSGKTNWVGKLTDEAWVKFYNDLAKCDYVHTKSVIASVKQERKVTEKRQVAQQAITKAVKLAKVSKKAPTTKRKK